MTTTVAVIGLGAVGARCVRQLASTPSIDRVVLRDINADHAAKVAEAVGSRARVDPDMANGPAVVDLVVLAGPSDTQAELAAEYVGLGIPVVSTTDDVEQVAALLDLEPKARQRSTTVAVGAGFGPGLSCILAAHAAAMFDDLHELHVSRSGTGGPACARQQHRALGDTAVEWRDGSWDRHAGGSGRELCWFPDPIGGLDCYRAALPDPRLLTRAFPAARRITARLAANRRARLTGRLPMMRPPHPEGGPGAIRVEARGLIDGEHTTVVYGAMDRPGVAAAAVAAVTAVWILEHRVRPVAVGGLAELIEPTPFLVELSRRGIRAARFEGSASVQ